MTIIPLEGWVLARVAALDEHHPGFAGHVLRASAERRQVITAFLAVATPYSDFRHERELGWFLTHASHDSILRAAFGEVPFGLRGALGRSGSVPHRPRYYRYLHSVLSAPRRRSDVRTISQVPHLDPRRLLVIRALPAEMRRENIIMHLESAADARELREFVALLAGLGIDRPAMIDALAEAPSRPALTMICRRWAYKARLPDHPAPATNAYHPITTGDELRRTALSHRNCMRSYLANVLERRSSFAVVQDGKHEAIVHLINRNGRWELDRIYQRQAEPGRSACRALAEAHLTAHGIQKRRRMPPDQPFDAVRRMLGYVDPEWYDANE